MIKTAVVILNWNGKHFLEQFLGGVINHSAGPDVEIYVADNGSTDESVPYLKKEFPGVKLILLDKNHGFSEGYNRALRGIDARYYVLLNSDVEVTLHWIDPVISLMDKDETIAACQPKIRSYLHREYFEYAGAAGGFIDRLGYPFCRGRILNHIEKDEGQYDQVTDIFWATGACMFVRASLFQSSGGLDPTYFAHMEEIDFCWRMKNMGYRILYVPQSTVFHVGGGTLPNEHPRKLYLNFRNNLLTLIKNLPPGTLFITLISRMILDCAASLKYLASLKIADSCAVAMAYLSVISRFIPYYRHRKKLRSSTVRHTHKEIYRRSVVVDFFLMKNRKFTQLNPEAFGKQ